MIGRLRRWARALKAQVVALWFAYRDPRTPRTARLLAICIVAYALSPIDLIPDFIPVLGFVDELLLLPGLIYLTLRLIPPEVKEQAREHAARWTAANRALPRSYVAAAVILIAWLALAWFAGRAALQWWSAR